MLLGIGAADERRLRMQYKHEAMHEKIELATDRELAGMITLKNELKEHNKASFPRGSDPDFMSYTAWARALYLDNPAVTARSREADLRYAPESVRRFLGDSKDKAAASTPSQSVQNFYYNFTMADGAAAP
eukprot:3628358-Rhodomonas_salina.1